MGDSYFIGFFLRSSASKFGWQSCFPKKLAALALYDNGNNLRACLILKEVDQNIVKMRQVAVSPALQGKGLGKIMVTKVELWIKYKGYKKIVLSARDTAVAFYLSMDYSIDGGIIEEVGIPHQSMFKIF